MMNMNRMTGIALAAMISFGTLGSAVQAAPFAASGATTSGIASGIEQVRDRGDRGERGGHRDRRHRGGHRDRRYRDRRYRHGFRDRRWYPHRCFWKSIRVYDPFLDGFIIKQRRVCR